MSDTKHIREPLTPEERARYERDAEKRWLCVDAIKLVLALDDALKAWIADAEQLYRESVPGWMHERGMAAHAKLQDQLAEAKQYGRDWRQKADECLLMAHEKDLQLIKATHDLEGLATQYEEETFELKRQLSVLRHYGNKDCTAQANEAFAKGESYG